LPYQPLPFLTHPFLPLTLPIFSNPSPSSLSTRLTPIPVPVPTPLPPTTQDLELFSLFRSWYSAGSALVKSVKQAKKKKNTIEVYTMDTSKKVVKNDKFRKDTENGKTFSFTEIIKKLMENIKKFNAEKEELENEIREKVDDRLRQRSQYLRFRTEISVNCETIVNQLVSDFIDIDFSNDDIVCEGKDVKDGKEEKGGKEVESSGQVS
jgi:hypothetical protein